MKKKLGPLQLWQWALIGAIVGAGTLLYRRGHPATAAAQDLAATATPSDAQYNPLDPTTGMPLAGGFSTGAGTGDVLAPADSSGSSGNGIGDLLSNFAQLEDLFAGLQGLVPAAAVNTDQGQVQQQAGAKRATRAKHAAAKTKTKKTTRAGHENPGHHVTHHGHGRKSASSSAPHNREQHKHVAPPAHQRHEPARHESAKHPAAKQPIPEHHTPAAHPPAPRRIVPAPKKRRTRR